MKFGRKTLPSPSALPVLRFQSKLKGDIRFNADEISKLADLLDVSTDVLLGREPLEVA